MLKKAQGMKNSQKLQKTFLLQLHNTVNCDIKTITIKFSPDEENIVKMGHCSCKDVKLGHYKKW